MISDRLLSISAAQRNLIKQCNFTTALKTSWYKENIGYRKTEGKQNIYKKTNILWYNPSYSIDFFHCFEFSVKL